MEVLLFFFSPVGPLVTRVQRIFQAKVIAGKLDGLEFWVLTVVQMLLYTLAELMLKAQTLP